MFLFSKEIIFSLSLLQDLLFILLSEGLSTISRDTSLEK